MLVCMKRTSTFPLHRFFTTRRFSLVGALGVITIVLFTSVLPFNRSARSPEPRLAAGAPGDATHDALDERARSEAAWILFAASGESARVSPDILEAAAIALCVDTSKERVVILPPWDTRRKVYGFSPC